MAGLPEVFRPNKYVDRQEPDHFETEIHAAGVIDWFAAGHEDGNWLVSSLPSVVDEQGFVPLAKFSKDYIAPVTYDPTERHSAAVAFLAAEAVSSALIDDLQGHIEWSRQKLDAGKGTLRAAIRAEALARGEYDPDVLILDTAIKRATDY